MNILFHEVKEENKKIRHIVVLFGSGLVGGAIRGKLILHNFKNIFSSVLHWGSEDSFNKDLLTISQHLSGLSKKKAFKSTRLSVVWAAGKAGFSSSEDVTNREMINYCQLINIFSSRWAEYFPNHASFYLISSAGGLFEGQLSVNYSSRPSPIRPYGFLKMKQEELLQDSALPFQIYIYRPSSIYGYSETSKRMGLIPTLLFNGIRYAVSHIFGDISTLRDYIASSDVGSFICSEIRSLTPEATGKPVLLAAGKPTSILEIKTLIERIIGRRLFISYDTLQTNSLDNTFSNRALPIGWHSVDLGVGIRRVYSQWNSMQGNISIN